MKQTVMEEVYENLNIMSDADFKAWMLNTDLLEKEKEQIFLAHINGQSEFDKGPYRQEVIDNAEEYYDRTFNTKER